MRDTFLVTSEDGRTVYFVTDTLKHAWEAASELPATKGWPCLIAKVVDRKTAGEALGERAE